MTQPTRRKMLGMTAAAVVGGGLVMSAEAAPVAGLTFEMYEDKQGEFRWRLKSGNGQIIGTSGQGYKAKADCKHGIEVIIKEAAKAKIVDDTKA